MTDAADAADPSVEFRPVGAGDAEALSAFFARVPEGDRTFFKEDVLHAPTGRVVDRGPAQPARSGRER